MKIQIFASFDPPVKHFPVNPHHIQQYHTNYFYNSNTIVAIHVNPDQVRSPHNP